MGNVGGEEMYPVYPDKINIDSSGVTAEEGAMAPFRGQKKYI